MDTIGRKNAVGPTAVAAPGNLMGWCEALRRFGTFSLADVTEPAIRHASRGFRITPYLHECVSDCAADMARDPEIARLYLPGGAPIKPGTRLVTGDYAETLRSIAKEGPEILYGGALGRHYAGHMAKSGGYITLDDLTRYRTIDRDALRGSYRGYEIVGPPPPSSGPLHIIQMLNILEGYDIGALGFASADTLHLLAEVLKIAFADRAAATADPAFVQVPVAKLLSKEYAAERRARISLQRAQSWSAGVAPGEGAHTTHLTVADGMGNVVASTQTINSLFGARYIVPGTGMIPNNYMFVFDPRPDRASSVAPGKRVTSSMSPVIVLRDGKPRYALGLPGGLRIFPSVMQALSNLIDHGMSVQEAVEAPRLWTQGYAVEVEIHSARRRACRAARPGPGRRDRGQRRRRHECDSVRPGRHDDRRCVLARRRHTDRVGRRPGATGCAIQAGGEPHLTAQKLSLRPASACAGRGPRLRPGPVRHAPPARSSRALPAALSRASP